MEANCSRFGIAMVMAVSCKANVDSSGLEFWKKKGSRPDPMGVHTYEAPDGTLGWFDSYEDAPERFTRLRQGFDALGCKTSESGKTDAQLVVRAVCDRKPKLIARLVERKTIYRLCAAGTDRLLCRSSWEQVHDKTPYQR